MKSPRSEHMKVASAQFPLSAGFLPLAIEFTDKAVSGFAFGEREKDGLVLAVEEIFSFYLDKAAAGSGIELRLENEGWRLVLTLSLRLANPDLRAFNLTYRVNPDDEASLAGLGPMIAARSVTRVHLDFGADDRLALQLIRERDYPPASPVAIPACRARGALRLIEPTSDDILHFAALTAGSGASFIPDFLSHPGMAADMLAGGAVNALLAQDGETMLGGVLWRRLSESTIELFGPYLFYADAGDSLLTLLIDEAVGRISRSGARLLVRRQEQLANHERFFDFLGELTLSVPQGAPMVWPYYYRQLREESGGAVYAGPRFAEFLRAEYERLCLPRQVRELSCQAVQRLEASVLSVEFEHRRSLATLRPLGAGRDMAENLAAHLGLLDREGVLNAIVEIDTGRGDDTAFTPALYEVGFRPRLLVPDAGRGDLVLFMR